MIRREALCNKLRELGYSYKTEGLRVSLWKKPGNPSYASIPRKDLLDEANVKETLAFTGCTQAEIKQFCESHRHIPKDEKR